MNIKMRDIIITAIFMFIVFPIAYISFMYVTGRTRLNEDNSRQKLHTEIAGKEAEPTKKEVRAESLAVVNTVTFQALQKERSNIEVERSKMLEDKQRMELLSEEIEKQKNDLKSERERIEGLVDKSDSFDRKKSLQMAKAYSAMRPAEAAQIISTLPDEMAIRILEGIKDDRIKAKIIAALPAEKATSITQTMVEPTKLKRN